jgi:mono/diheme cytochrome c family protein
LFAAAVMPILQRACACIAATCILFVVSVSQVHADSTQQEASSVFDGVFTVEQSARGEAQYLKTCKKCHKKDLSGDLHEDVKPLVGDKFRTEWAKWTVGDMFEFLTTDMPPKAKDRRKVSAENYADILAYILEKNGFPAGKAELLPALEPLLEIEMSPSE